MNVAFVGLGVMGFPMARHLATAGHEVRIFNRTRAKAERFAAQHGGTIGASPPDAGRGANVVLLCVGSDDDVREVVLGEDGATGVLSALEPGAVIVDHTTTSARLAREVAAACAERGVAFLDAPVSGGQAAPRAARSPSW